MNAEDMVIECSWTIENFEDVRNKILWKDDLCELTQETNLDNCFMVSQTNCSTAPCTLKFILKNNRKFSCLQILSEVLFIVFFKIQLDFISVNQNFLFTLKAPMIEVYGQFEEYLQTNKGDQLDEVDGTYLFECKIDLKKLHSEVLLKVIHLKK